VAYGMVKPTGTNGKALKCHISAVLWLSYLQTRLFISIYQTAVEIITQWSFPTRLLNFRVSYGKIMTSQCSQ